MSRIAGRFAEACNAGRAALVAYITAGDPSPDRTPALIAALERGGADIIELGVPFSDPIADGPVIQRAADRALHAGMRVSRVLDIAREVRRHSEVPLVLFSYLNPLMRYGFERLAGDSAEIGIDGVLLIDLSVEEAEQHVPVLREHGLDTIFLATPTSTPQRLESVGRYSSGFVYLVSRTGVTGERQALSSSVPTLVHSMRAKTDLPLAVGFGISTPEQASEVAQVADGVVVGSSFVRVVEECAGSADLEPTLEQFTRSISGAMGKRR